MKKVYMIIVLILVSAGAFPCFASPYFLGTEKYSQPDGKIATIDHIVDEFGHIYRNNYGPVILNNEGYWCYGRYDKDRNILATPYLVGEENKNEMQMKDLRYQNDINNTIFLKSVHKVNKSFTLIKGVGKTAVLPDSLIVILISFYRYSRYI
ncbi:MAG: hypothetical protein WCU00_03470 [Candidatus Latescibacterota bacterium]|jgi:hypothetical protein